LKLTVKKTLPSAAERLEEARALLDRLQPAAPDGRAL